MISKIFAKTQNKENSNLSWEILWSVNKNDRQTKIKKKIFLPFEI